MTIQVSSVPAGAQILESGRIVGRTPLRMVVPRGQVRSYTLRLAGYQGEVLHSSPDKDIEYVIRLRPIATRRQGAPTLQTPYGKLGDLRKPNWSQPPEARKKR